MKAVGYVRVSTDQPAESGLGLESQRGKIQAAATLADADVAEMFEDAGMSAKNTQRPELQRMLELVKAGGADAIIIAKLDRLSRSIGDMAAIIEMLGKAKRADGGIGVDLISAGESINTATATGRMMLGMITLVSQWERETIGERTRDALAELKAQGKAAGMAPFGMSAGADGYLVENPAEQEVLECIRQGREKDGRGKARESWDAITSAVNSAGYKTRGGKDFTKSGIYSIGKNAGIK